MSDQTSNLLTILNPNYKTACPGLKENMPSGGKNHLSLRARLQAKASPNQKAASVPLQEKTSAQKAAHNQHRAGDWVCILCHNHNYSFREICNRCNVQTKVENLRQSLSFYQNQNFPPNSLFAQPFPEDTGSSDKCNPLSLKELSRTAESKFDKKPRAEQAENVERVPFADLTESCNKEFPFEKQLYFSSEEHEDLDSDILEDENLENAESFDHEKRILKFLNFD